MAHRVGRGDGTIAGAALSCPVATALQNLHHALSTMLYMILARDGDDVLQRRLAHRPAHLARLEALRDQGRLLLAGPLPRIDAHDPGPAGFVGSLIVAEFASLADANAWAAADPFRSAGVYVDVEVHPFRQVLP